MMPPSSARAALTVSLVAALIALSGIWVAHGTSGPVTAPATMDASAAQGTRASSGPTAGHGASLPAAASTVASVRPADATYVVTFEEEGLPNGSTWYLSFNGGANVSDPITNGSGVLAFTVPNGSYPFLVQPNMWYSITNASGTVLVSGTDVTVGVVFAALPTVPLTFREGGLLLGTSWSVTLGYPALLVSTNRTWLTVAVPNVSVPYALAPPVGYGTAKVVGPTLPSQTLVNVSGRATVRVTFAPLETVYFNETGLPPGSLWGVQVLTPLPHGGAPGASANTTSSSVSFTLVKAAWKFALTGKPSTYLAHPGKGTIGLPAHTFTKTIRFTLIYENVVFRRTGLLPGTTWGVNITGPMNVSLVGTTATLRAKLGNGSYAWTAWNQPGLFPHAASGADVVVAPSATHVIVIAYTSTPVIATPSLFGGPLPMGPPTVNAGVVFPDRPRG